MSRALDKATTAALKAGNPQAAYDSISSVLVSLPSDGLLEIEILGKEVPLPEGTHVLQDGLAVGVSKLGLVQAFLVARRILKDHIQGTSQTDQDLSAATAVILLMDPEFLTAANTRKRLIQRHMAASQGGDKRIEIQMVLDKEKRFLDSLLTSRLHRHTKSPTLWSHRRWLVETFVSSLGVSVDVIGDVTNIVFVAGERHPRNYYAWCHARILTHLAEQQADNYDDCLKGLLDAVKKWCFRNHTDISGWSFLFHLLDRCCGDARIIEVSSTFSEVLDMSRSLRLTNESVWVFLRTLAASGIVDGNAQAQFITLGQELLQKASAEQHSPDEQVLRSALDWYETYRRRRDS
ncbi:hypothetical protein GE21DRAFT_3507 [Neurospora crassa]|uniref:Protein prenyltransferase n=1 Tax=Neurospora crassa (strain ATCC 24698 / 74-OR23-1A / CBS 708.71 / DSM 1257 / FGSC 987) TaxID=367110 RepID=V5IQ77_NEUCR|nr:hypothetical protein NCU16572 [Neurospora crassa OR74A]ESA43684.1 hypothetical protein NCU16572 [Neurospora crassa OR74A]KHE80476.1 hypothetical protein GE21DRAFT_3507 [Neurospora crassa]|eukprot:XP_011393705.1 hypothetical protein NCU16572 [Neurospora crassa OR74A]